MVTPCPPSVYMLIPPISVRCNLVFVANSTLSAVWQTYSHLPPEHTRTRLSGSICVNLKSVTSCHHDSLRSSPSPWLLFARPCTRMCMCGGHISRVKLGLSSLAACLLPLWWENICWLWYEAWEYLFLSPSLLHLLFRFCYEFPSCSAPSLHVKNPVPDHLCSFNA